MFVSFSVSASIHGYRDVFTGLASQPSDGMWDWVFAPISVREASRVLELARESCDFGTHKPRGIPRKNAKMLKNEKVSVAFGP